MESWKMENSAAARAGQSGILPRNGRLCQVVSCLFCAKEAESVEMIVCVSLNLGDTAALLDYSGNFTAR
jgi:hypothetical protein